VIDVARRMTSIARLHLPTERCGTTGCDGAPHLRLSGVQVMLGKIGRTESGKHLGHTTIITHDSVDRVE
jgi:hypothetical protein